MGFTSSLNEYNKYMLAKSKKNKTKRRGSSDDEDMAPPGYDEIGHSGLDIVAGEINEEYNTDLTMLSARAEYYIKMRNDGSVDTALNLIELPVVVASYDIFPAGRDSKEMEATEFCRDTIYNRSTVSTSYSHRDTLKEESKFMQFGFFPYEEVWKIGDWYGENFTRTGMILLKKLALRHPKSIDKWDIDEKDGSVLGLIQEQPSYGIIGKGGDINIPIEKMYILIHNRIGNNFEGISVLRPLVKHWSYKNGLYKIESIGLQRNAMGIPTLGISGANRDRLETGRKMLRSLMVFEEAGITYNKDKEVFDYKQGGINTVAIHRAISHHDSKIYQNVLAGFMLLGQESRGGARNLGMSLTEFYLMMSQNIVDLRCDIRNRYLISRMVRYNYSDIKRYPQERGNLNSMKDKYTLATILDLLAGNAFVDPTDVSIREYVHSIYGLPEPVDLASGAEGKAVQETEKDASENKEEPANKAEMSVLKWMGMKAPSLSMPNDYRERWIKMVRIIESKQRDEIAQSVSKLLKDGQVPNINYIDVPYNDSMRKLMKEYSDVCLDCVRPDDAYRDFLIDSAVHTHDNEMKWEILDTMLEKAREQGKM